MGILFLFISYFKGTSINYIFDVPLWAYYLIKSGVIIFDNNETPDF
mgnify:CR=1 FL=1